MSVQHELPSARATTSARRIVRRGLTVWLVVIGMLFSLLVFAGVYASSEAGLMDGVRQQARSLTQLIMMTRHWNAAYGGVWVSKSRGAVTNPLLRELGVEPDVRTQDGDVLTLRNPALMTREISELLRRSDGASFRLTSLDPINLANTPDDWEAEQLRAFIDDDTPKETVTEVGGQRVYRRITPLYADSECLVCHAARGTRLGDVRGGISVDVPLGALDERRRRDAVWLGVLVLAGGSAFLGLISVTTRRVTRQLEAAESELSMLATTDVLTGLANRRTILARLADEHERAVRTGHGYGVIAIDIDHFKRVNDTYGHACGDAVLEHLAGLLRDSLRGYDFVGRTGGEEFLAVIPEAGLDVVKDVAQRIHRAVRDVPVECGERQIRVTVSIGVALLREGEDAETVAVRADEALYRAKREGRDRVCVAPGVDSPGDGSHESAGPHA